MFDKNKMDILYTRKDYSFAEGLYENYINMRKNVFEFEKSKYAKEEDSFVGSKEGKEGFLAGVYIMLSLIGDM